jgi:hypothetical protein
MICDLTDMGPNQTKPNQRQLLKRDKSELNSLLHFLLPYEERENHKFDKKNWKTLEKQATMTKKLTKEINTNFA